jgi:hypothetical protein
MTEDGRLRVLLEGTPLPTDEARAFWQRFSAWMAANAGDLAGFARQEGLASVHPEMHAGAPVLVASRNTPQRAYTSAPKKQGPTASRPQAAKGPRRR